MVKNRIDVVTLGCSKNLVDSEQLMAQFEAIGYKVFHDAPEVKGEVVVLNTCGFIGDAKEESIAMILQLAEAKKHNKIGKLIVMGCLSERYLSELTNELPEVDAFYGKFNWQGIVDFLGHKHNSELSNCRKQTTPIHYAYVKIAEGCNRTCSYCAIPIITGKYKSRQLEDIVSEVEMLVENGVREIQLIAQDLTFYGLELYKENKLPELVARLAKIPKLQWIRLHYGYPTHFPFEILPVMRDNDNVCAYFDIALQHISDNMLKLMRRNITKEETYKLIARLREEVPNIHLRTTLLTGHPGESEKDFEELIQFVKDVRFERLGAFAYSDEEGTYAHLHYKDNIPQEVKEQRVSKIMEVQEQIAAEINAEKIGKTMMVVIDRIEDNYYIGRTEYDSPEVDGEVLITFDEYELEIGEFYDVVIDNADNFDLYASPIMK